MPARQPADSVQECLIVAFDRAPLARAGRAPHVAVGTISIVVPRREQAFGKRSADAPSSMFFTLLIAAKIAVEMFVMKDLVSIDPRGEILEHRLLDVILQ